MKTVTAAERPDLVERAWRETIDSIPEYNHHGDVINAYWSRLTDERPEFQFVLLDEGEEILARGHSLPVRWDGSIEDLPAGIDGAIARGFDEGGGERSLRDADRGPAEPPGSWPERGGRLRAARARRAPRPLGADRSGAPELEGALSARADRAVCDVEASRRLALRPLDEGPRTRGATILKPEPHSLRITGTVGEWEGWTQMAFPESGNYWFPGGLTTVEIDHEADVGSYWEPNVWMHHAV